MVANASGTSASPVVIDDRIAVPEGDADEHATTCALEVSAYAGSSTCGG